MQVDATVVLLGDYDGEYFREVSLRDGLRSQGVSVRECRFRDEPLFPGPRKLLLLPLFYWRIFHGVRRIAREEGDIDVILVTKFNPLMLPIAALLAWRFSAILVYDLFVSLARTVALHGYARWKAWLVYWIERGSLRLPDYYLTETAEFASLYADYYGLPRDRIFGIPVGANEEWFHPQDALEGHETFKVVYWGNFLPHHGLDTILDSATFLAEEQIEFVFLGDGPEKDRIQAAVQDRGLEHVEFHGRVPLEELSETVASADIALGIFADDPRSRASITNKVSEGIAAGVPVVTMRSPVVEELFDHGDDIYLVPPEDGQALAEAILTLRDDSTLRSSIAKSGRETYEEVFTVESIGELLVNRLSGILEPALTEASRQCSQYGRG